MIEVLLPTVVKAAEEAAPYGETHHRLFPEEIVALADAVEKRRREFASVRTCARRALCALGEPPAPILPGTRGAPRWPTGIVGSMTHTEGYRAAAVARAADVHALGIDAEPNVALPDGILDVIAVGSERSGIEAVRAANRGVAADRLLFSAKESVYKVWFPLTGRFLDFSEADITLSPDGTFVVHLLVTAPMIAGRPLTGFKGSWRVAGGLVLTAVVLLAAAD